MEVAMRHQMTIRIAQGIAHVTLTAEKRLHALDFEMCLTLQELLQAWEHDEQIGLVILDSLGQRAFCAGGDIIMLYEAMGEGDPRAQRYFTAEYTLDHRIHCFPKPILCLADGVVMGGGMGLMNGASHRLVTENTRFAMPELSIGFFPDVGASYFLSRLPRRLGLFLGLSGARLQGGDMCHLGLAEGFLPSERLPALIEALHQHNWQQHEGDPTFFAHQNLSTLLSEHLVATEDSSQAPPRALAGREAAIDALMASDTLTTLAERWSHAAQTHEDRWLREAVANLASGSPTSAAVFFEQLRRGKALSLAECFAQETHLARQFTTRHDFREGIRARLIDKDRRPHWDPPTFAEVSPALVEAHFVPLCAPLAPSDEPDR